MDCTGAGSRFYKVEFLHPSVTPDGSRSCQRQIAHPDQIVGRQREGEHPSDPSDSAVARLAQASDGLEPAEDFFDAFAFLLADHIAGMTSGALIDDAGLLAARYAELPGGRATLEQTPCGHTLCRHPR